jgi:hypothetical protein
MIPKILSEIFYSWILLNIFNRIDEDTNVNLNQVESLT